MAGRFEELVQRGKELESYYGPRNAINTKMDDIFLLKSDPDIPDADWIKQTLSPDGRNSILGGVRLLAAGEPTFSVPIAKNRAANKTKASKIEKEAAYMWQAASNIAGYPLHADLALSALLYGEIQLSVTNVADMIASTSGADQARWKAVSLVTPVIFEIINPAMGYPEFDALGLRAYYSKRTLTVSEVRGRWGEKQVPDKKEIDEVTLCEWWDLSDHYVWVEGEQTPILGAAHGLDYIPVVAVITEGSRIFGKADYTRQPLLYTMYKSGLLSRQNLSLSLMFSLSFAMGANPMYIWRRKSPDKEAPEQNFDHIGGLVVLDDGEEYASLAKQVIDPSLMQMWQLAQEKGIESTFYRQAFGESLGANATFSETALLSQAGRLPLVMYQRMLSFAIARAMQIALKSIKSGRKTVNVQGEKGSVVIEPDDITDDLILTANIEINQPQDQRQNIALASQATNPGNPLVSQRYALEELVGVQQPDEMLQEIMYEQFVKAKFQIAMQQYMQQAQQGQAAPGGGAPGAPGGMGGGQPMGGAEQGGMPPELMAQMQAQQQGGMGNAQQQGGLPPELMAQLSQTGAQQGIPGIPAGAPMPTPGERGMQ